MRTIALDHTEIGALDFFIRGITISAFQTFAAGYRLDFLCSVASISNKDTTQILCPRYEVFLGWSSSGRGNFFLWSRLFFFELETNFSVFQFEVSGKGAAFFGNKFVQKIGFSGRNQFMHLFFWNFAMQDVFTNAKVACLGCCDGVLAVT